MKPSTCHPDKAYYARGLCKACYYAPSRQKRATCHDAPEVAGGLCAACYRKQWREANLESERSRGQLHSREWRASNPKALRDHRRAYRLAHPETVATHRKLRKTRMREAPGAGVSKAERAFVFAVFNGECAYCSAPAATLDHVVPIARGGADDISNVLPACLRCNASKHAHTLEEWLAQ